MKKLIGKIMGARLWWLYLLLLLGSVNYLATIIHGRIDLTKEKRYTLSKATRELLGKLDEPVQIDVFLKGEFPAGFRKLANSTEEFLQLLKDRNGSKLLYRFISPQDELPGVAGKTWEDTLLAQGANAINLSVQLKAGEESKRVYPVAMVKYKDRQTLVNLYSGGRRMISPVEMNSAEAMMEYQFAKALDGLLNNSKPRVGYLFGNGEPTDARTYGIQDALSRDYNLGLIDLKKYRHIPVDAADPGKVDVLISVKPRLQFTEDDKFKLDQYLMKGGKLMFFLDNLIAEQDSLRFQTETVAYDRNLNLTDQLFKYGVRVNTDLVMDLQCDFMPFAVGGNQENPQYEFLRWNYYPLFESKGNHTINKNIGLVAGRFVNSLDTIAAQGIRKTALLQSSSNSRIISTPALISLNENRNVPQDVRFNKSGIPVAYLLEGRFSSLYRNRLSRAQLDTLAASGNPFIPAAEQETKIIVAGDGDLVLNDFSPKEGPLPLGMNFYTVGSQYEYSFANRDFFLNSLEYLVNRPVVIETRNKDVILRLLDTQKVKEQKSTWQFVNIALPLLLVLLAGWFYQQLRKRKYAA